MTPSWESVLHLVESDVRRTEALLRDTADPRELVTDYVADPTLPPLNAMPPVPLTLAEQMAALFERIARVRAELETSMRATRALLAETVAVRPVVHTDSPRFVDTLA